MTAHGTTQLRASLDAHLHHPRHLRRVLPAVLHALGRGPDLGPELAAQAADAAGELQLPDADRAVVVLVDGLGVHNLDARKGHAPYLRRLLHSSPADPTTGLPSLSTCAPSTTAAAITTLGTAALPGATGMVGYEVRDPVHGAPVSLIAWENTTLRPRSVQQVPTLAERLEGRGLVSVAPARFAGTGLTEAALRGWPQHSAESLQQRVNRTVSAFRDPDATLAYLYWGEVDHTGHGHGWESEAWVAELEHLDAELRRLSEKLARLPGTTLLLVTADHGMVDVARRHDVTEIPALGQDVVAVAGDLRAPQLYLNPTPGRTADPELAARVAQRWSEHFDAQGTGCLALTRAKLEDCGALGALGESARALLGDVTVFLGGRDVVVDPRSQSPGYRAIPGVHGSLTAQEMTVPLLLTTL